MHKVVFTREGETKIALIQVDLLESLLLTLINTSAIKTTES